MNQAEFVIIGGGVVGASVAYHLTGRGARDVLILERGRVQGGGSTGKATGGVRAQFGNEIDILMSLYSLDFFERCGFDCRYEPKGYLFLATDDEQMFMLGECVKRQHQLGYAEVSILDRAAISEMLPALNCKDILGGSFGPRDGFIDPLAVMHGFTTTSLDRGARTQFDTDVTKINVDNGRVRSVSTSRGEIECGRVVLCAGAWSRDLALTAGISLPVEPVRRQLVWSRCRQPIPGDLPMVIELGNGFHFRPAREFGSKRPAVGDARDVLMAFPDPYEPSSFATDFDTSFVQKVLDLARHRAPFLCDSDVVLDKCRAGLYENTPDRHPILGGCEIDGLFLACGFSGHGVMHSPAAGRAVTEIMLDGQSKFLDVACLSYDRFSRGELIEGTSLI